MWRLWRLLPAGPHGRRDDCLFHLCDVGNHRGATAVHTQRRLPAATRMRQLLVYGRNRSLMLFSASYNNTMKRLLLISALALLFGTPAVYCQVSLSEMEPESPDSQYMATLSVSRLGVRECTAAIIPSNEQARQPLYHCPIHRG